MTLQIKFSEESPKLSSRSQGQGLQSALIAEAQDWRNQWKEERKKFSKLQGNTFVLQSEFNDNTLPKIHWVPLTTSKSMQKKLLGIKVG